jgi:KaiC/GvpD/RAD55 family RecA-like ATPase
MTRIVICGGPRTGKTTLARQLAIEATRSIAGALSIERHSDDLIAELAHLGKDAWSEGSRRVTEWLDAPGPWIIEGVALARALRKWREAHPGEPPPVDRVIRLTTPHVELTKGQAAMAKGEETVWAEVEPWLAEHGVEITHS